MDLKSLLDKYKLPETVQVEISRNEKGGFFAKLVDYPGCFTVADSSLELIQNVTDAILTYFEVSRNDALKCNVLYGPPMPDFSELERMITQRRGSSTPSQLEFLYYMAPHHYGNFTRVRQS